MGDPVQGGRVPDVSGTSQWMRYKDAEVVSRLEERTLSQLSGKSPHVTYYPARTRPFDLVPHYQQMIAGATDDVVVGELRQVRYTEGYPYLLGLSVALWLASSPLGLPAMRDLVLLALLLPGCTRRMEEDGEAAFQAKFKRGDELLQYAQEQAAADSVAQRSLLLDAREEFLRAALLRPGDIASARRITAITRRLREVEAAIEKQRAEEQKRHEELAETIERLQKLTVRQTRLSQQSSRLLRRRLVPPKADLGNSSASDNEMNDDNATADSNNNDRRLARPASTEQQAVREETANVLDSVTFQQNTLRQLLTRAYGDIGRAARHGVGSGRRSACWGRGLATTGAGQPGSGIRPLAAGEHRIPHGGRADATGTRSAPQPAAAVEGPERQHHALQER